MLPSLARPCPRHTSSSHTSFCHPSFHRPSLPHPSLCHSSPRRPRWRALGAGLCGLALALVSQAALSAAAALEIEDALVRAVPPVSTTTAVFMTLHNHGEQDLAIIDAASPAAEVTELHNHLDVDGVMQMRQVPEITVPAGGSTELAPGGLHLMLIDLVAPLREDEEVEITLTLEDDATLTFTAPVKRIEVMSGRQHGHHGEHHAH